MVPAQALSFGVPELIDSPAALRGLNSLAASYVAALRDHGTSALVTNAASDVLMLRQGDLHLPITVDDGAVGRSYVASPHSAYVLYARDEVALLGLGRKQLAAHAVLGTLDGLLRMVRLNRAVHLDNWLLSTNLHGLWEGQGLDAMRALLAARYPDHFLIIRSLDEWTCPALLNAARADGWTLLPSRQVWVTDDLKGSWHPRNQTRNDARALKRSGLVAEQPAALNDADCARIADLYHQLYVGRYSAINPIFSPRFIALSAQTGLLRYCLVRDAAGTIMAFAALRSAGGVGTVPLMGYDMACPQDLGLYRIASYLAAELAMNSGLRFHGSSGASEFKRNRGAHGVIEYMAVDARHLSPSRRAGLAMLAAGLNRFMTPMLERNGW
ncbi:MAG: hypothetical protein B7Y36_12325 [Novosphingobium sp. 28-62-57]|nr:MAG: hypothetical protein B7Z34_10605 [Novosphingobium sp. 12-62-10]OYZ09745.1 MAG: hypothetical protein B7Y36_12325 [Novosphingobium sp. 28-62-57]OZA35791.1 MAG: hypothetical protein B7X92_09020 [Novosphingobium sp. 17-62-9]